MFSHANWPNNATEEGVDGEIQKRPNCKSKEIESQAVLNRKVSNIKTFLPRGDGGG